MRGEPLSKRYLLPVFIGGSATATCMESGAKFVGKMFADSLRIPAAGFSCRTLRDHTDLCLSANNLDIYRVGTARS